MIDVISVTGTKGKTTVCRVLADVLATVKNPLLLVDSSGAYINGRPKMTLDQSVDLFDVVPTVSPGRMLTFLNGKPLKNALAILETSVGSSARIGLGYRRHKVGVFTNIFEDHIGSTSRLKSRQDIASAKDFIFRKIDYKGIAVFNSDEELIIQKLDVIPKKAEATLLPVGRKQSQFIKNHLKQGGEWVTIKDGYIVIVSKNEIKKLLKIDDVAWTFQSQYSPSVFNLMLIMATLWAYFNKSIPREVLSRLKNSKLDNRGGRLTVFDTPNGVKVIADYAHETKSLIEVANLAKTMAGESGRIIGVLRLSYSRSDELIQATAASVAPYYDKIIVYDKIDGHFRKAKLNPRNSLPQVVGKTSQTFYDALRKQGASSERIIREDRAIAKAAKLAGPRDVVVAIVNDDAKRSVEFIKKSFSISRRTKS
jgi:cyanophycin synthetase